MTLPVAEPDGAAEPDALAAGVPDAAGVPEAAGDPDAPGDPEAEAGGVEGGNGMYVQPGCVLAAQAATMVARAATAMTLAGRAKFRGGEVFMCQFWPRSAVSVARRPSGSG